MNLILHTPSGFSPEASKQIEKNAAEILYEHRNHSTDIQVAELGVKMREFCARLMPWVQPRIGAVSHFDKVPTVHLIIVRV